MIEPAPVEQAYIAHLNAALAEPVSTRVPASRPAAFVRLTRTGGQRRSVVLADSNLLVECWGSTETLAWDLCRRAWSLVAATEHSTVGPVWVNRVRLTDPVNFPDSASGSPRYQFIVTATVALPVSEEA